jgi:dienelactone hydrolase
MDRAMCFTFSILALALVTINAGCGGGGAAATTGPITISLSANAATVPAGGTVALTASASNDTSNKGVTWAISPASGAGTLSNVTGTSVTYNAPAAPPASDTQVIITATSVADPSQFTSTTVTLVAIAVFVSADLGAVPAGGTAHLTGAANNDPSNKGVTWAISPTSGAGTLSNAASGSVTYSAPATPPASDVPVTITATSIADTSKSGSVVIAFAAILVAVSTDVGAVPAGGMAHLTGVANNDSSNKGVTWAISPASGAGTLSSTTGGSVTYSAPATPPASDVPVTITATSVTDTSKSGSVVITFAAISVSVSLDTNSVPAGSTAHATGTANSDPSNQGVTWAISPASGAGTLSDATSTTVTYNAPATPPASNTQVTITATSVADTSKSGTATITLLAIAVSVKPVSVLIPVNITQDFTGTVANDPAGMGVNWSITQNTSLCPTACGTIAPASTASGAPATYTAPATLPADPVVAPVATSISDPTKSASAAVTLTLGSVKLVPNSLNFGSVKARGSASRTLTVALTNTGSAALSVTGFTFAGAHPEKFSQTNTCGASVAAGASCTISVTFTPRATGSFSADLAISDSSSDSPQHVALVGRGAVRFLGGPTVRSALAGNPVAAVPRPTGLSAVGTREMDLVDSTRDDPFLVNGTKRELLVRFWYPASPGQVCKRADYASPRVWGYFSRLMGLSLPEVHTNSCWNASMADGAHPVVVFTHGYTGTFTDYTFVFEDLASRGYVVASVDHTYEATAVEFPDGRLVQSVFGSHLGGAVRDDEPAFEFAVSVRLSDLKFIVNELELLNVQPQNPFAGKLDVSSIALAGHSLGGLTALLGVEEEPRFKAGIIIDGSLPGDLAGATDTPVLLLAAGREVWSAEERSLWGNLRGPRLAVNFSGAEHVTPSDAVWLARNAIKTGPMGPEKTIAAMRDYIAAFLDAHLRGKPSDPLLKGQSSIYPDAEVVTQKQLLRGEN